MSKPRINQHFGILKLSVPCIFKTNVFSLLHHPKAQYCVFDWCNELSTIFLCPLQRRRHNNEHVSNGDVSSTRHLQRNTEYVVFRRTCFDQVAYPSLLSTSVTRVPSFKALHSPGPSIRQPLVYCHNHHPHLRRGRNPPGSI